MKRIFSVTIFSVLAFAKAYSQNKTSNLSTTNLYNTSFEMVDIDLKTYIKLEIANSKDGSVKLLEVENGEYKDAVSISAIIESGTLKIRGVQPPTFVYPQDKLSAHKVIDSRLNLLLPEGNDITISVNEADIILTGSYNRVYVNQQSGSCVIKDLKANLNLISIDTDAIFYNNSHHITFKSKGAQTEEYYSSDPFKFIAKIETVHGSLALK